MVQIDQRDTLLFFFNGRYDVTFHTFNEQVENAMISYEGRSDV
jgi:hypothetical protein